MTGVQTCALPIWVAAYWFREVASGRPGVISKVGIDTAIDPDSDGGGLNALARRRKTCTVRRIYIGKEDYLLYEAPKPDFALIRATSADFRGNLDMADEAMRGTVLSIAQATKAMPSPGKVAAQVRRVTGEPIRPRSVEVPGPLVDYVVVSPEKYHWQTGTRVLDQAFSEAYSGAPTTSESPMSPLERVVARRVLAELLKDSGRKGSPILVNLGIGIPALVSRVSAEAGTSERIVTVLESGQWGGVALSGVDFGVARGPFALSTMPDMFSNFEGGTIDAASLGFLQVGEAGDVNPSMLPGRMYGPGGFPVIAGGSPRVYFAGAFTASGTVVEARGGRLKIMKEGGKVKFVKKVYRSFFSAKQALRYGKQVLYITERAVLKLEAGGLMLKEVAPGVDLERDVLGLMEFKPRIGKRVGTMDKSLFRD